ncbi:MAG: TetR/AcrR family transcriptional regulator [Rhodospirillaceae bacterium]|nr:TetR/AcrR family transcriptional regulator [Rhodospirillaceae bacterium]
MGRTRKYDRHTVLEKAMGLFWQKGFLATSIADITETTALNTASMYKEFGDKDGLFEGALEYYRGFVMAPRFRILTEEPNLRGVEIFLESVARGAAKPDYKGCLMMNHLAQKHAISAKAAAMIDDFCAAIERLLEAALRNAQAAGQLPADKDPAGLASYIMCCVHGLVLYGRHPNKKRGIVKIRDTILRALHG